MGAPPADPAIVASAESSSATSAGSVSATVADGGAGTLISPSTETAYRGAGSGNSDTLAPGALLGPRYEIVKLLGKGGMGAVYLAHDRELQRDVALKLIAPQLAADADTIERFRREIHLSSIVTHPNVLRVYDLGESDGVRFLTMQFIEGRSLADLVAEERPLPVDRAVALFRQICEGLAAAHEKGVLHRDLKPQNVMVDAEDRAYLTDFGLATSAALSTMTRAGALMGTPQYMSPEQVKGQVVDARSDVFSLGVMLYELLSGELPYTGDTPFEIMIKRTQAPAPRIAERNAVVPVALGNVIERCLAIDPAQRYVSVSALLADLDAAKAGERVRGVRRRLRWRPLAIALATLSVLAAGVAAGPVVRHWIHPPAIAPKTQTVLVADFDNRTGESVFNGTLEPALATALEGASFITTFNRGSAQKLADRLQVEGTGLSERRARLVAQREGVGVVTVGYVERDGRGYRLGVRAVDAFTGQRMVEQSDSTSSREGALQAVIKLAAEIRRSLGDVTPVAIQLKEGETFSASSLEAAHEYGVATALALEGKWEEARERYSAALKLDPALGRAYSGLAVLESNRGLRADADGHFQQAMAHVDRMTERERYRSRGAFYLHSRDPDQAIEAFTTLVKQFPADYAGLANLALAHSFKHDFDRALLYAQRAITIYPGNVPQRNNVGFFAMYAGNFAAAIQEQQKVLELNPNFRNGYIGLALAQLASGDRGGALATWGKLQALGGEDASVAIEGLADLAMAEGRIDDALALLEPAIGKDVASKWGDAAGRKLAIVAEAHLLLRHNPKAAAAAERALRASSGEYVAFEAATVLAQLGDKEIRRARAIADQLDRRIEPEPRMYAELVRGTAALRQNDVQQAIASFKSALQRSDSWLTRFALARAYVDAGAFAQAQDELDQCEKRRGEATDVFIDNVPTYRLYPPARYYLARAHEKLKSPAAVEAYKAFLALKHSDEAPVVVDARRRLASLEAQSGTRPR